MKPAKPQKPAPRRSSVVDKRRANNGKRKPQGLENRVTDNDPMQKDSLSNYP